MARPWPAGQTRPAWRQNFSLGAAGNRRRNQADSYYCNRLPRYADRASAGKEGELMEKTNRWGSIQAERDDARLRMFQEIQAEQSARHGWREPLKIIVSAVYLL